MKLISSTFSTANIYFQSIIFSSYNLLWKIKLLTGIISGQVAQFNFKPSLRTAVSDVKKTIELFQWGIVFKSPFLKMKSNEPKLVINCLMLALKFYLAL